MSYRFKNPTGLISFLCHVLPYIWVTLFGGMAECMEYCNTEYTEYSKIYTRFYI